MTAKSKIAILIDGDNAESGLIEQYISEAEHFGRTTVKRIYADWTDNRMKNWKEQLNKFAIRPMQKFAYTTGKNSTDTALIIDTMDLLHSKLVDGICIISSDSDYTGLAHRIREEGLFIMGIGKSHTPEAFVKACQVFIFSETLQPKEIEKKEIEHQIPKLPQQKITEKTGLKLVSSIKKSNNRKINFKQVEGAFRMVANIETGQAQLSSFSTALRKIDTTFDHKDFGYSSFKQFCMALSPHYQIVLPKIGTNPSLKKNY